MAEPTTRQIDPADLVGQTEIAIRAGVSDSAVFNWAARHYAFPKPVRVLTCGSIWAWSEVAAWLTTYDLPNPNQVAAKRTSPDPTEAAFAVCQARRAPRTFWADIAHEAGISRRHLVILVAAGEIGEEYGWFTRQRREADLGPKAVTA
jgi:predicted DNA-binding transcriptional regulator AlpA